MPASPHLIEYDNLSMKLMTALAGNALNNISSSAGKMLDVACFFFDQDISNSLLNFHKLYLENGHLDEHKDDINQQADEIFAAAQGLNCESVKLDFDETSQKKIAELANVQKELEALIQQDNLIKERMVPVMQCMQYEDLISNRIQRLILCWEYMMILLRKPKDFDMDNALQRFHGFLSSEDEHQQFFKHVFKCEYQQQELKDVNHDMTDINALLERIFEFSYVSLNDCIVQTQQAFDELIVLLDLVTGESSDVSYLFSDKNENLLDIKEVLSNKKNDHSHDQVLNIIKEISEIRAKHSAEAAEIIQSFMVALQSQDIIRQNIENIGHVHQTWDAFRPKVKSQSDLPASDLVDFGQSLIDKMTSHPEHVIIAGFIPGVESGSKGDESVFF
jgi:hypothetical protein